MDTVGFPLDFSLRMKSLLGEAWPAFAEAHLRPSPTSIRLNPFKKLVQKSEHIPWCEGGYYLEKRPAFTFDPLLHAGAYYVQEASSMFLEQALKQAADLSKSLRVLDACAAPGGKSTHLLSLINNSSLLVSNEVIKTRATILAENICKWGTVNAVVTQNDPEDFSKLTGFFDVVLVDAPCSGEGLFRKDPKAMNEWSDENARLCSLRQQRIINHIWPTLKTNGILIYSTCTYNPKENEENLKPLIQTQKAKSIKLKTEENWSAQENFHEGVWGYQFFPHRAKGEGFFISVLKKMEKEDEVAVRSKKKFQVAPKKLNERLTTWVTQPDTIEFVLYDDLIIALPKESVDDIDFLASNFKAIQKGTAVATIKHDKLIPEHAFALSNELNQENFQAIDLTYDQAIAFLRKESLYLGSEKSGFTLMKFQSVPIGWVNHLGNRINNLYPANWRIRSTT